MKCVVAIEGRFSMKGGMPASHHLTYERFWSRYLHVFDSVIILARLFAQEEADTAPATGPGVSFVPLPSYLGPVQYIRNRMKIARTINQLFADRDIAVIARMPGIIGTMLTQAAVRQHRPYGVEVVADPYDAFAPGAITNPLRGVFRWMFTRQLQQVSAGACATAYVTQQTLQQRYPPSPTAFTTHYSSIVLPETACVAQPRHHTPQPIYTLVTIGSMAQTYKGFDVLLEAVARCRTQGLNLQLRVVGDGKYQEQYARLADTLGIASSVHFCGRIPAGDAVRTHLDAADLFVLPSRTEGLPRAMIEAMARGVPCIGSTAGGIPELLNAEDMVPPGDATALADTICAVLADPARMAAMSARNLAHARQYTEAELQGRRNAFYRAVRTETERWLQSRDA